MADAPPLSDRLIGALDQALKSLAATPRPARPSPASRLAPAELSSSERRRSGALMRVNHAGEIAAQALYLGQSLGARAPETRRHLLTAAAEERDHLAWCAERLADLGARPSLLTPAWFAGSFAIGAIAGALGDAASLGFVAETERQVEAHLDDHLQRLPARDAPSAAVLAEMAADEARHGAAARQAGGVRLPAPARALMSLGGGLLRGIALWM